MIYITNKNTTTIIKIENRTFIHSIIIVSIDNSLKYFNSSVSEIFFVNKSIIFENNVEAMDKKAIVIVAKIPIPHFIKSLVELTDFLISFKSSSISSRVKMLFCLYCIAMFITLFFLNITKLR